MKALSLHQPWASLWVVPGAKVHETRHWPLTKWWRDWTPGARLVVHAAQKIELEPDAELRAVCEDQFGAHWAMDLPRGALVGVVRVMECKPTEQILREWCGDCREGAFDIACGNFDAGRFGFRAEDPVRFKTPVPWRGRQNFFEVTDDVVQAALGGAPILHVARPRQEAML